MTTEFHDTIVAISTPPGIGGVAMLRISGPDAFPIVSKIWKGAPIAGMAPNTTRHGDVCDPLSGEVVDDVMITKFVAPKSYTGQDTIEITCHGSIYIQQALLKAIADSGARLANPGEYTQRAFAAGKIDLLQAEAIGDIIAARSKAALQMARSQMKGDLTRRLDEMSVQLTDLAALLELEIDFSEEDVTFADRAQLRQRAEQISRHARSLAKTFYTGDAIKNGVPVAIIGQTNAGKSSLLNALTGDERAIVSDIHGTTRDTIEDTISLGNHTIRLVDTAGLRDTDDPIERLGIERSREAARRAAIVIIVEDATTPETGNDETTIIARDTTIINVLNKTDLPKTRTPKKGQLLISAKTGDGIDCLRERLIEIIDQSTSAADVIIANRRHYDELIATADALDRLLAGLDDGLTSDLLALDLRQALHHLGLLTGRITDSQILSRIFSSFCIGK